MSAQHTNRLVHETSPYLLQHAHNPVDWYPWGEEALVRARAEQKLILLSIGYSACHWCHVMERESFENEAIAAIMNEHFVNIKVDREERPDLDDVYMAATVAMNHGQGGWPMTVFLTPELEPVFAGTYFPPDDVHGRPGFPRVMRDIAAAWRDEPGQVRTMASRIVEQLRAHRRLGPALPVGEAALRLAASQYADDFDEVLGGFGSEPKFPPAVGLMLLLRLHRRFGDASLLHMVRRTLDAMAAGGIYDHLGGGFARYATDAAWLVPHFEKMLYDNALLARAYLEAWQVTGEPAYRRVAVETLDYVLREMTAPEGGFYSSTDADSEGEEGRFFVWRAEEIEEVLGAERARIFGAYYGVRPEGNWEGANILHTPRPLAEVAAGLAMTPEALDEGLAAMRRELYDVRRRRVPPGLDDKILTAWNGLMISACAEGYRILGDPRYKEAADRAAAFMLNEMVREDGSLLRTFRGGRAHLDAYLEDYAQLAEGLIDLYESGGAPRYLVAAERLADRILEDFGDPSAGALFNTGKDHERLFMRYRDGSDGATPSANAVAASVLARLSFHLDRDDLRVAASDAIRAYGAALGRYPRAFAKSLMVVDFLLEGPVELAILGRDGADDRERLCREVGRHFLPNRVQAVADPSGDEVGRLPLLAGKTLVGGRAGLYVCRDYTCAAPVTDPAAVASAVAAAAAGGGAKSIGRRLPGSASAAGTRRYAARHPGGAYRPLGSEEVVVSAVGFGGYRVSDGAPEHDEALCRALMTGINLIDTSSNYGNGGSERLVGRVVNRLVRDGDMARDEVVVVSKIGYVQGDALAAAKRREASGTPFAEMVKLGPDLWHCIHPAYLAEQLDESLARLELETLDVCLLHNPEYYLAWAAQQGADGADARREFDRRLREAFGFLETQVDEGIIRWYGVSSNTVASDTPDRTSFRGMLDAARAAAGDGHRFRVLQLPLNLLEPAAAPVVEEAASAGVAVLANRPLNAFVANRLVRLAEVNAGEAGAVDEALAALSEMESGFRDRIAPAITVPEGSMPPDRYFRWAEQLKRASGAGLDLERWARSEAQVRHSVAEVVSVLDANLGGDTAVRWAAWREPYLQALTRVLACCRGEVADRARAEGKTVRAAVEPLIPPERRGESLGHLALWIVASTPGVTSVLNGMRDPDYVRVAGNVMRWDPCPDVARVYGAVPPPEPPG